MIKSKKEIGPAHNRNGVADLQSQSSATILQALLFYFILLNHILNLFI